MGAILCISQNAISDCQTSVLHCFSNANHQDSHETRITLINKLSLVDICIIIALVATTRPLAAGTTRQSCKKRAQFLPFLRFYLPGRGKNPP